MHVTDEGFITYSKCELCCAHYHSICREVELKGHSLIIPDTYDLIKKMYIPLCDNLWEEGCKMLDEARNEVAEMASIAPDQYLDLMDDIHSDQ